MAQTDERYYATYCRLDKNSEGIETKIGPNNIIVGTEFTIKREDYVNERGKDRCRGVVTNIKGDMIGFLPETCARRVCDLISSGWVVRCAPWGLSYSKENGAYYVDVAVICYEPQYAEYLGAFAEGCFERLGKGERPDLKLGDKLLNAALQDKSFYKTVRNIGHPKQKKGEAYYKTGHTFAEDMAIEGSKNNPGCWVGTIAFYVAIIAIVASIVYFLFLR